MIEGTENACGTNYVYKLFVHLHVAVVNGEAHRFSNPTGKIIFVNYVSHIIFTSALQVFILQQAHRYVKRLPQFFI